MATRSGRLRATLSSPTVSRSTTGGQGLGERSAAILDFAVIKITDHLLECELEDLERLKGFGLSEEVWDVVETLCP